MMPVKLGLGDAYGGIKIVVGQGGIENLVAVVFEIARFNTAWNRIQSVDEEEVHCSEHGEINLSIKFLDLIPAGAISFDSVRIRLETIYEHYLLTFTETSYHDLLDIPHLDRETIKSAKGPPYKLIYASKHDLGLKFWNIATSRDASGQRDLFE